MCNKNFQEMGKTRKEKDSFRGVIKSDLEVSQVFPVQKEDWSFIVDEVRSLASHSFEYDTKDLNIKQTRESAGKDERIYVP